MYGQTRLEESRIKQSKKTNTTGYYRVIKVKDKTCKQGFKWRYQYHNGNVKQKQIDRVNLDDLEKEVKRRGLLWVML